MLALRFSLCIRHLILNEMKLVLLLSTRSFSFIFFYGQRIYLVCKNLKKNSNFSLMLNTSVGTQKFIEGPPKVEGNQVEIKLD